MRSHAIQMLTSRGGMSPFGGDYFRIFEVFEANHRMKIYKTDMKGHAQTSQSSFSEVFLQTMISSEDLRKVL